MPSFLRRLVSNRTPFRRRFSPKLEVLEDRMLLSGNLAQFNLISPDTLHPNVDTFGSSVTVLRNGNVVVTDPTDSTVAPNAGAVFLYNGQTGALLGEMTGSTSGDLVGSGGVTALTNGNFVVSSPNWQEAGVPVGAATWFNGNGAPNEAVSSSNSLVGFTNGDQVASFGVTALTNGNYVVDSPFWQTGGNMVGAVTWGDGSVGSTGAVSAANSLIGSTAFDTVGSGGVTALSNGNYVVSSPSWQNPNGSGGAATWGNGTGGTVGPVSAANSLVAGPNDGGIAGSVTALSNGDYVVSSPGWSNGNDLGVGAVTWANGSNGQTFDLSNTIDLANSLFGSTNFDQVGSLGVTALSNGNYVVSSPNWQNGGVVVGAVTWGMGDGSTDGPVSGSNSLVGSTANDRVGSGGVTALSNGNYVVSSPNWQNGGAVVGAVTWSKGDGSTVGPVGTGNSLVGSTNGDQVGLGNGNPGTGVTALSNGNYVVSSPSWQNGGVVVGAVTWSNGSTGTVGVVSTGNSLVGSTSGDQVGAGGVAALTNGNYVVSSPFWHNSGNTVGAVTWANGSTGTTGTVTTANSLVGSTNGDDVGNGGVIALSSGDYIVSSPSWHNGGTQAGAATWGNGTNGQTLDGANVVSGLNSLIGNGGLLQQVVALSGSSFLASFSGNGGSVIDAQAHPAGSSQTISFGPLGNQTFGVAPITLSATTSSGLSVSFAVLSGPATVSGKVLTITGVGTVTVEASQPGNTEFEPAIPVDQSFTVAKAATTAVVASSANPVLAGQLVTFTVTISSGLPAPFTPTGMVQFQIDGQNAGSAVSLSASGTATFSTSALAAGSHTVTAGYSGNANFLPSTAPNFSQVILGPGVTLVGSVVYAVGGTTSNDNVQITPVGASNTGSTGVKVQANLNKASSTTTFNQAITAVQIFACAGNDNIQLANTLTVNAFISAGNGNDNVQAGGGNITVALGNGNDNVQLGNGNNVVVTGNGHDNIQAGNGDNLIVAGLGQHNVQVGNGSNILIDGSVTLTNSNDSLRQVLNDWMSLGASDAASIRSRLSVTDNSSHANVLLAGTGLDWFWETYAKDVTDRTLTDLLN
jgi:hypothetical protein